MRINIDILRTRRTGHYQPRHSNHSVCLVTDPTSEPQDSSETITMPQMVSSVLPTA